MMRKINICFILALITSFYNLVQSQESNLPGTMEYSDFFNLLEGKENIPHRNCGTMEYLEMQKANDPNLAERMERMEEFTQQWIESGGSSFKTSSVITIPVVVHVVYNTSSQNISDAQIQSQIDVLNADFRKLNADFSSTVPSAFQATAADCGIEFCLASVDANGNSTSGIVRKSTSTTSFSYTSSNIKYSSKGGDDAWSSSSYLNIWVCKISGGVLGYAQVPGGASATDGVVIDYRYFGTQGTATYPYDLGRTTTHEVGHWLNLYHIWGDDNGSCSGTDYVSDTPGQANYSYGCPNYPETDNCTSSGNGIMFMTFMDYTDDECMGMFSSGQSSRIQSLFTSGGSRASILSSNGCGTSTSGGSGSGSGTGSGTGTGTVSYCSASGGSTTYEWIKSVTFGGIVNSSGNDGGYGDYTATALSVTAGKSYSVKLEPGFKSKSYTEYWTIWVDYNQDGDFDDSGEKIASGASKSSLSGTVTISSSATAGSTRMRIAMKYGSYPSSACESFDEGEIEDYTLSISGSSSKSLKESGSIMMSLNVFPNPAQSVVSVVINNFSTVSQPTVLKMQDARGRIIYSNESLGNTGEMIQTIDVSSMAEGIYILSLHTGNDVQYQKVLISR
jgi:hypothetical protein